MRPEDMPNALSGKKHRVFSRSTVIGVVLIAAAIILIIVGAAMIFAGYRSSIDLAIAEYSAQMAANGAYKEDIHLLNQFAERRNADAMYWLGILTAFLSIVPGAWGLALLLDF